jgi:hypothetical protein
LQRCRALVRLDFRPVKQPLVVSYLKDTNLSKIVKKNLSFERNLFSNKTMGLLGIGEAQG